MEVWREGLELAGLDSKGYHAGDRKSVRGPCFVCGGHQRMLIFFDKAFPSWWVQCDECGIEGWLDQFFPAIKGKTVEGSIDDSPISDNKASELILSDLRNTKPWIAMHDNMTESNRFWWRKQGIPDDWQDFWKLGFVANKSMCFDGEFYTRDAYSIPKFGIDGQLYNIDYRVVNPPLGAGKYRPEPGLLQSFFVARPDFGDYQKDGMVLIVEGSKKAMVSAIYLGDIQVLGVPARRSWAGVVGAVRGIPRVIVVLDPDADVSADKLIKEIGPTACRVTLPTKPDDGFLSGVLTPEYFWKLVERNARRTSHG